MEGESSGRRGNEVGGGGMKWEEGKSSGRMGSSGWRGNQVGGGVMKWEVGE